jgi:hypothetical protein
VTLLCYKNWDQTWQECKQINLNKYRRQLQHEFFDACDDVETDVGQGGEGIQVFETCLKYGALTLRSPLNG